MAQPSSPLAARVLRGACALLAPVLLAVACSEDRGEPTITGTPAPTTTTIPFAVIGDDVYAPPDPLPEGDHGDLIWAEEVGEWWGSPRRAWQVLYLSEALDGRPVAVSGFVVAPASAGDGAARPVVAWAHETVGAADVCAPSRTFAATPRVDLPGATVTAQLMDLVDGGAVVVASDYEGLGTPGPHPFLVGASEGRGVLDAVLAAQQLPGTGAGDAVVLYGVSQGGHAALWAAQLAPEWAPALDVAGVVAVAPFSEVDQLLPAASSLPGGEGYVALGVFGQAAANPLLSPADVLVPAAIERAGVIESACLLDVSLQFGQVARDSRRPIARAGAFAEEAWRAQLASIKPGLVPLVAPLFVVQGGRDLTVPAPTTAALVARLCSHGDLVERAVYPDAGHADVVVAADGDVRVWLGARLAAETAASDC